MQHLGPSGPFPVQKKEKKRYQTLDRLTPYGLSGLGGVVNPDLSSVGGLCSLF
jgi:hypothetical protein